MIRFQGTKTGKQTENVEPSPPFPTATDINHFALPSHPPKKCSHSLSHFSSTKRNFEFTLMRSIF